MFAAALIVYREVLEAALIVTIIMAATRSVPGRGRWISLGITGGVLAACGVASITNYLSSLFEGSGQEIINACILSLAVALIGWHVIWMNSHGRKLAAEIRAVGHSVSEGSKHMSVLSTVIGLAVMREGSEIVLMLQGLWANGETMNMFSGGALGLIAGIATGAVMYAGFVAFPVQKVFALTNIFLTLIAAGMAARAANLLAQADLLPSLGNRLWDTSTFMPEHSLIGQFLTALVGYIARPSGVEVLFYATTLMIILALTQLADRRTCRA